MKVNMETNQFMMMNIPISIGKNKVSFSVFMFKIASQIHVIFQNLQLIAGDSGNALEVAMGDQKTANLPSRRLVHLVVF
jgi:hypothetical protein